MQSHPLRRASILRRQSANGCIGLPGKPRDELRGGLTPRHSDTLSRPKRKEFRSSLLGGCAAQRPRQRILEREGNNGTGAGIALDFCHEPVDDATRRTPVKRPRNARFVLTGFEDCLLVRGGDSSLVAGEER